MLCNIHTYAETDKKLTCYGVWVSTKLDPMGVTLPFVEMTQTPSHPENNI